MVVCISLLPVEYSYEVDNELIVGSSAKFRSPVKPLRTTLIRDFISPRVATHASEKVTHSGPLLKSASVRLWKRKTVHMAKLSDPKLETGLSLAQMFR